MAKKRVTRKPVPKAKAKTGSKRRPAKPAAKKAARRAPKRRATKVAAQAPALQTVTPYLCCKGAAAALDFYDKAFGAIEMMRMTGPDGSVGHADIQICGASIMLSDEWPGSGVFSPTTVGGTPVAIHVYVPDVDALFARAIAAGATALGALEDMPYGDRQVTVQDPFGHRWMFATKKEEVDAAELQKRFGSDFTLS